MIVLVRHGQTEWSLDGRHTGSTDIPLTPDGEEQARRLGAALVRYDFERVLVSPMARARTTCELAGLGGQAEVCGALAEWDYGEYEGVTSAEIHTRDPQWRIFDSGAPGGETPEQVGRRADRVLAGIGDARGPVAVFAHGHILRVLAVRWLGLPAGNGRYLGLSTASISELGREHGEPVISLWNDISHLLR